MTSTGRWLWLAILPGALQACGAPAPAADPSDPPPSLEEDAPGGGAGPVAQASSPGVQKGIDAIQAGDFAAAKGTLEQAVQTNPEDAQAHFYLGVALDNLGEPQAAIEHYEEAVSLDSNLVEARANLSGALYDGGDAAKALEVADAGLAIDPKHPALLTNRAMALAALDEPKKAAKAFEAALAVQDSPEVRFLYAETLARGGETDRAKAELKKLAAGDNVEVLASAARLLGRLKAFDGCIEALDRAIEIQDAAELRVQRGLCRHGKKDEAGAKADYEAAIAADAGFAAAHFYLGQHLKAAGDKKGAKKELKRAMELDPQGGVGQAAGQALKSL